MLESLRPGFTAVIFGASGGIGDAALSLLKKTDTCGYCQGISRTSHSSFDLTHEESIADLARQTREELGEVDLLFDATGVLTANGQPPEKALKSIDPDFMMENFAVNTIGPALLLKHFSSLLPRDRKAVFATLSARVGSISDNKLGGWYSYRASKAALNQIVKTASIELARTHPQTLCVALQPGTVETRLSRPYTGAGHKVIQPTDSVRRLFDVLDRLDHRSTGRLFDHRGTEIAP